MKIDSLNKNKLRISLSNDEIFALFGSYEEIDYANPQTRRTLNSLLKEAELKENFYLDSSKITVEVTPEICGCIITVTKISDPVGKRLKRIRSKKSTAVFFSDADAMIDGLKYIARRNIRITNGFICRYFENYILIFYCPACGKNDFLGLREFGRILTIDKTAEEHIREYGTVISKSANETIKKLRKI